MSGSPVAFDARVAAARAAQTQLSVASAVQRRAFVKCLRHALEAQAEALTALLPPAALAHAVARLSSLLEGPDPLGSPREGWTTRNGAHVRRERVPVGVVGIVYEDNALYAAGAAALAVWCGNAIILRPSRAARDASRIVARCLRRALRRAGLPRDTVQIVIERGRDAARRMRAGAAGIDLTVLRGQGGGRRGALGRIVAGPGRNHLYVDASADAHVAAALALSSRLTHPGRCTAVQVLLLHAGVAEPVLCALAPSVTSGALRLLGCARARDLAAMAGVEAAPADDETWTSERRGRVLAVRVVDDLDAALAHIARHGSGHSEGVAARDEAVIVRFRREVDAAYTLVNASFASLTGEGLGLGAPGVGVKTDRAGGRGMLGIDAFTTDRWIVDGAPLMAPSAGLDLERARRLVFPHHDVPTEIWGMEARCITGGRGVWVTDHRGRRVLDGLSMLWVVNAGHGQPEIVDALVGQARRLAYGTLYGGFLHPPVLELAQLLEQITPGDLGPAFFASGGAEAVEAAIKLARHYHQARGERRRRLVFSFKGAYHGMTLGALSATGVPALRKPFEPLAPEFRHVEPPLCARCPFSLRYPDCRLACVDRAVEAIDAAQSETVSAFIAEPILSPMGNVVPPTEYWPRLREALAQRGILLVFDEVRTGFGRSACMFATEAAGVVPDILVLGKGLASGYAPISAAVMSRAVAAAMEGEECHEGFTFGGHPLGAAAACANIRFIRERGLVEASRRQGERLAAALTEALADVPFVGGVWGRGLQQAIAYVRDRESGAPMPREAQVPYQVEAAAWERGLYLGRTSPLFTHIAPPLCIDDGALDALVDGVTRAVRSVVPAH